MKVKVLVRNPDEYMRETKQDIHKMQRNYAPDLHPLEAPREYTRALNAVKLERVFAKPFLGCLEAHRDGVSCIAKHPERLSLVASGAYDGEVIMWSVAARKAVFRIPAHDGVARGLAFTPDGQHLISVGDDQTIKTWQVPDEDLVQPDDIEPVATLICKGVVSSISHQQNSKIFATSGEAVQLWEGSRDEPIKTLKWGMDSVHSVHFNPVQTNLIASCASDRSVVLYDTREATPLRRVVLAMKANRLSWNPMEAFNFTVASEDFNLYTFDCRKLKAPLILHAGHTCAVTDIDYAPTGQEFVTGGYDKTVRIFETEKCTSREVYHTKRMQRLTCVAYTLDARFIISGSDEMNLRLWKAIAWEKLGVLKPREKAALQYNQSLKEKFAAHPKVRQIAKHRHVPKHVYNAAREHQTILEKNRRKEWNRRRHSKPGSIPQISAKAKAVIQEME